MSHQKSTITAYDLNYLQGELQQLHLGRLHTNSGLQLPGSASP
jgi:hypothetical protein